MHVTGKKNRERQCHSVSLLSCNLKYLTCYVALFSDWSSAAVKYEGETQVKTFSKEKV